MCVGHVSGQGVTPEAAERVPAITELPCRCSAAAASGVCHLVGLAGRATIDKKKKLIRGLSKLLIRFLS